MINIGMPNGGKNIANATKPKRINNPKHASEFCPFSSFKKLIMKTLQVLIILFQRYNLLSKLKCKL